MITWTIHTVWTWDSYLCSSSGEFCLKSFVWIANARSGMTNLVYGAFYIYARACSAWKCRRGRKIWITKSGQHFHGREETQKSQGTEILKNIAWCTYLIRLRYLGEKTIYIQRSVWQCMQEEVNLKERSKGWFSRRKTLLWIRLGGKISFVRNFLGIKISLLSTRFYASGNLK